MDAGTFFASISSISVTSTLQSSSAGREPTPRVHPIPVESNGRKIGRSCSSNSTIFAVVPNDTISTMLASSLRAGIPLTRFVISSSVIGINFYSNFESIGLLSWFGGSSNSK